MDKRLYDVEEIAEYLGVRVCAMNSWVSQREIPYVKIGSLTKFDLKQIDEWILENSVGGGKEPKEDSETKLKGPLDYEPKEKICKICREKKHFGKFYKDKRCKDGRVAKCKACMAKEASERWQRLKEEKKAKQGNEEGEKKVPWGVGGKCRIENTDGKVIFENGKATCREGEEWLARKKAKYAKKGEN